MHSRTSPAAPYDASRTSAAELSSDAPHSTWLTAAEAARYLKIKTRTILFWAWCGKIKAYSMTGATPSVWRFAQRDADAILIHSSLVLSSAQPFVPCL